MRRTAGDRFSPTDGTGSLDARLTPTRLLHRGERPPIEIVKARPSRAFHAARTCSRLLGWALRGLWLGAIAKPGRQAEQGRRLRLLFDELGGFWIKVGQLMSIRTDVFSAEFCQELSSLQDQASGFPFTVARQIVEAELGAPLARLFDVFEETPFAAASIGQIHKAHLARENVWVAVKVQRPFVAETMADELRLVRGIVRCLEVLSIWRNARWRDGYWELEHILREEVDYRYEASNIRRMRRSLRRHNIIVPKVFERYSSRRLLVMEFVEGALMADCLQLMRSDPGRVSAWLAENNIDQRQVAHQLCLSLFRQLVEDNLYHGDMHPGNIILLRNSRVALIDCGTVGFLNRGYLDRFRLLLRSLFARDYDKAAELLFLLSTSLPVRNLTRAKEDLVRVLRAWGARTFVRQLPYTEKSVANAWQECNIVYMRYNFTSSWEILRIHRAITTLDATLMHLYPEANYTELGQQYFRHAEERTLRDFTSGKSLNQTLSNLAIASELPAKAAELAFFGASLARRQSKIFESATSKAASLFAVLFGNLSLLCMLLGAVIMLVLLDRYLPAAVGPIMTGGISRVMRNASALESQVWLMLLAFAGYLSWRFAKLARYFARQDGAPSDVRTCP
jgi:ubiquinone biosynthesis protein